MHAASLRWHRFWVRAQIVVVALMWVGGAVVGVAGGTVAVPLLGIVGAVIAWRDLVRLRGRARAGP